MTNRSPRSLSARRSRTVMGMARASSRECTARVQESVPAEEGSAGNTARFPRSTGCQTQAVGSDGLRFGPAGLGRLLPWWLHSCSPVGPSSPEEVEVRKYEILLILPADADDKVIGTATDRISQVLAEHGGSVDKVDRWGKRRLAYEIRRQTEGLYLLVECQADPAAIKELDRVLGLADEVIRFKVVVRAA